jgi:hypothetical protein
MNKKVLYLVFAFAFSSVNAQENIIKAGAFIGNIGLQYERSISNNFSVVGQIGYSNLSTSINNKESVSKGLGYYFEGRYYFSPSDNKMQGWHIGPYYNRINVKDDNSTTKVSSFGLSAGYQWVFNSQLTLNAMIGGGTLNVKNDKSDFINFLKDFGFFDGSFLPHIGISFGYNF